MTRRMMIAAAMFAALPLAQAQGQDVAPPRLELAIEAEVLLEPGVRVGETAFGGRNIIPIVGGSFVGEGIKGEVLPGGWDWQLFRKDGCAQLVADYFIRTDDGVVIKVHNEGPACPPQEGQDRGPILTHPTFEAPLGKYEWLSKTVFVGAVMPITSNDRPAVKVSFYRLR